jgi:hypothetical protein
VRGEEALDPYASGLTMPEILWPLSPLTRDTTIEFRYDAGLHPQVGWRELPTSADRRADVPNVAAQPAMSRIGIQPRVPE